MSTFIEFFELYVSAAYSVLSSLAGYVFLGLGLSRLAKALECPRPWLAWIPFGCLYLLGQVADIYTDNRMTTEADRAAPFYTPSDLRRKLLRYGIWCSVLGALASIGMLLSFGYALLFLLSIPLVGMGGEELPWSDFLSSPGMFYIGALMVFVAGSLYLVLTIQFLIAYCPALCRIFTALGVPSQNLLTAVSVFVPALGGILIFAYTRRTEGLAERFARLDTINIG